jgi:hypothetical protein
LPVARHGLRRIADMVAQIETIVRCRAYTAEAGGLQGAYALGRGPVWGDAMVMQHVHSNYHFAKN